MSKRPIVHVEIPVAEAQAAASFYKAAFGWDFEEVSGPMPYTMFQAENLGGGYSPLSEQTKVGDVLVYIGSEDIEADLKRIEDLGGKVVMGKAEITGFGEMAIFTDLTGNRLALWRNKRE